MHLIIGNGYFYSQSIATLQIISIQALVRKLPSYRRYLYDDIDFNARLLGIKGARGAGKSIILQYVKTPWY